MVASISTIDFLNAYNGSAPSLATAIAALHTAVDATGDVNAINAANVVHQAAQACDAAALALVPSASRPEPQDGGGGKTPPPQ